MARAPDPLSAPADSGNSLFEAVAAILRQAGVGHGRLCCALSGGVDSVVLLHLLVQLRATFGYRLSAAHVHHGLSPHADAWLAFCAERCRALDVPFQSFRVSVPRNDPAGLEAAARAVRHAALAMVDCDWLVLGHHQDDLAETVLFRLLRGAGVRGVAAMKAIEPGSPGRLRPLLQVRRAEILAHARAQGLTWVEDESNADPRYTRNALRHHLLPEAQRLFPAAVPALARAAANFREAADLLDALAAMDEAACGGRVLGRAGLLALDEVRVRNLLRWQIRAAGAEVPSRARLFEAVRQLREGDMARPLRLGLGQLACCAYRDRVWLEPAEPVPPVPRMWQGEAELPWGTGRVRFTPATGEGIAASVLGRAGALVLTTRWPGLTLQVHSRRPRRSFKKLCQEAGIPSWMRDRLPVLAVDGEAAWIGEIGCASGFACTSGEAGVVPVWEPVASAAPEGWR